jgi:anthranilate phosphoribosyltransferase
MIKELIGKLIEKNNLTANDMEICMQEIMNNQASPAQMASFLTALRLKGETIEEITAAAKVMRKHMVQIKTKHKDVLDTCGTGGDGKHTFNISTLACLVASGAGAIVAKHGNRSVSSKCGSADLLEALGVKIDVTPEVITRCLDEIGIAFLFAQNLHPAMKFVVPVRKEIGIRTIFNILGPLANPANAKHQLLGVYRADLTQTLIHVLKNLGSSGAIVVHGQDGLDEITTTANTLAYELKNGRIKKIDINPRLFGIKKTKIEGLKCFDLESNKKTALNILNGEKGPRRDIVLLNAAYALYVCQSAKSVEEAYGLAKKSLEDKKALEKLEQLKKITNQS